MNMPLVSMNRRRRIGGAATPVSSPSALFALAEPGVWYDPSDLTTLFQDTAGTQPVTTPGQTVALALDKSKGGRQTLPTTGWAKTSGDGTVTVDGNTITITGATTTTRVDIAAPGFAVGDYADITVTGSIAGATGATLFLGGSAAYSTLSGTNTFRNVISASNLLRVQISTGSATFVIPSRGYVPGFHATQATLASRPTYGIVPLGGRRNLLTYSEDLTNAVWSKIGSTVSSTLFLAPDGTTTANRLVETATTGRHLAATSNFTFVAGANYTFTVRVKAAERQFVQISAGDNATTSFANFDVSAGTRTAGTTGFGTIAADANGFYLITVQFIAVGGSANFGVDIITNSTVGRGLSSYAGNTANGILIWGAQLETGSSVTAYQRVGSAFDVTEAGVASLSYLSFDGVDDWLVTPTITPGIDRAQVFAGVRPLSTTANQTIYATDPLNSVAGSFGLRVNTATALQPLLYGSSLSSSTPTIPSIPVSLVTTQLADIGAITGLENGLRVNGGSTVFAANAAGTGNFSAQPLYIGRYLGTSNPFNGQLYSLIVRFGTNLDAGTITSTETWVGGKTGVTL